MREWIKGYFTPPTFAGDVEKTLLAQKAHIILLVNLLGTIIASIVLLLAAPERLIRVAPLLPVLVFLLVLNRRGRGKAAMLLLVVALWLLITMTALINGGIRAPGTPVHVVIILFVALLFGIRAAMAMAFVSALTGLGLVYAEETGLLVSPAKFAPLPFIYWFAQVLTFYSTIGIVYLAIRDVPEALARAHEELAERKIAEEKYRNIFDNAINGIFQSTPDGRLISVNPAMARMYGYKSPQEMVKSVTDIANQIFIDPRSRDILRKRIEAEEEIREYEALEYRKDKSTLWTSMNAKVIRDEYGNPLYYEGTVEDITQRKQVENERENLIRQLETQNAETETLRESFASIVGTFEFAEIIEHILDQIGRVVPFDSASVWKLEGNVQKLITSRNLPINNRIEEMEITVDEVNSAVPILRGEVPYILNRNVQEELLDFKDPPHNIINSWLAIPLKTRGKIIGLIALDGHRNHQFNEHHAQLAVTFANQVAIALENARLFSELQNELFTGEKLIKELESKNAELERFTYTVSHDLKSPIITIRGFLGFILEDIKSGNNVRLNTDIKRISDATDRMQHLLNDLLDLSRIGRLVNPPQAILFEDLVNEALANLQGQLLARGVKVIVQQNLPTVNVDRIRLVEVIQNLVGNACNFMGEQPKPKIEIGQYGQENGNPIFGIKDNGIGIAIEHHERIYGLFNKLDTASEGTGIGLALVKSIIEFHGGRIWVESEAGKGAAFYFTLAGSGGTKIVNT